MPGFWKMALVVRTDLGMGRGKGCAQCAHAAVQCYMRASASAKGVGGPLLAQWLAQGQKKVVLRTASASGGEAELARLEREAREVGLVTCMVRDAGRTQLERGTPTVLGLGPGPEDEVDHVTGHLKLL